MYINREIDYPAQQSNILGTIQAFQRSPWVEQTLKIFESMWLAASPKSVLFNAQNAGLVPTAFTPLPAAAFYPFFQQGYIQQGGHSILQAYHCKNLTTQARVDCRRMDANTRIDATATTVRDAWKSWLWFWLDVWLRLEICRVAGHILTGLLKLLSVVPESHDSEQGWTGREKAGYWVSQTYLQSLFIRSVFVCSSEYSFGTNSSLT